MRKRDTPRHDADGGWKAILQRGLKLTFSASLLIGLAAHAKAQNLPINPGSSNLPGTEPTETQSDGLADVGRTAETGIGGVGERTNILANPMGRINSRIQNRVQNRIRNRIDRDYDLMDDTVSPFEQATDQLRQDPPR